MQRQNEGRCWSGREGHVRSGFSAFNGPSDTSAGARSSRGDWFSAQVAPPTALGAGSVAAGVANEKEALRDLVAESKEKQREGCVFEPRCSEGSDV